MSTMGRRPSQPPLPRALQAMMPSEGRTIWA